MSDESFEHAGRDRTSRARRRQQQRQRRDERKGARGKAAVAAADGADEELDLDGARRLADRKVRVTGDALKLGVITVLLLILKLGWIAIIVLVAGGAKLLREFYRLVLEPKLRERFIDQEVSQQVRRTIGEERQELEGRQAERLEQLSASIAHEIRNPITAAKSLVQQMGEDPTAVENVEYARVAVDELHRVERSVSHLLQFARDEEMRVGEIRLADVVESALETFRDRVARRGVTVERQMDCEGRMRGDAEKLRRVIINLVGNAIEALEESGTPEPRIDVQMGENLAGTEVWLRVRDNGPGLDADAASKIWSPFFTSKANGTGLGLPLSRKLTDAHGGRIDVESEPGQGAGFLLTFPKNPPRDSGREGSLL